MPLFYIPYNIIFYEVFSLTLCVSEISCQAATSFLTSEYRNSTLCHWDYEIQLLKLCPFNCYFVPGLWIDWQKCRLWAHPNTSLFEGLDTSMLLIRKWINIRINISFIFKRYVFQYFCGWPCTCTIFSVCAKKLELASCLTGGRMNDFLL